METAPDPTAPQPVEVPKDDPPMEDPQRDDPPMEQPKPPEHPMHDPLPEPPAPGDPLPLIKDPPMPGSPPVPPGEYARSRMDLRMRSRKLAARAMADAGER